MLIYVYIWYKWSLLGIVLNYLRLSFPRKRREKYLALKFCKRIEKLIKSQLIRKQENCLVLIHLKVLKLENKEYLSVD